MKYESSKYQQHLKVSLFLQDPGIEFFGFSETKKVVFSQKGKLHPFEELDNERFAALSNALNSNMAAREHLNILVENGKFISNCRKVELYTFFIFGGMSKINLNPNMIPLKGSPLLERDITLLDLMVNNKPKPEPITGALTALATQTF